MPFLFGAFHRSVDFTNADVIDENVDSAEMLDTGFDACFHLSSIRDVHSSCFATSSFLANDARRFFRGFNIDIAPKHLRSFAREQYGDRLAVTPPWSGGTAAHHERDFIFEF